MQTSFDKNINDYFQNLLEGNHKQCSYIAKQVLGQNLSIIDLYEHIFKTALYKIGKLWEENKISVATEHTATAITESIMNELFERVISEKRCGKKVVVACVENEQHQVGIKMVADVFELNGWDSFFIGNSIPTNELIRFLLEKKPDILAISLSVYFNYTNLIKMLKAIRQIFPDLQVIIGGQAFYHIAVEGKEDFYNVIFVENLYMLNGYIKFLNVNN